MKLRVKLFAAAKQLAGTEALEVELPDGATVAELRGELLRRVPGLARMAGALAFAVNADYAGDGVRLVENADVACIPPVSGG